MGSPPTQASKAGDSKDISLLERGEADLERGEYRKAAEDFSAHYRSLPLNQRTGAAGEYVVMYAADVYDKAWGADADIDDLKASRALLYAFVSDVESAAALDAKTQAALTKAARKKIVQLDTKMESVINASAPVPTHIGPVQPPVVSAKPKPHDSAQPGRPDTTSIALLATGGILAGGGIAMLALGLAGTTARRAQAQLDKRCEDEGVDGPMCADGQSSDAGAGYLADATGVDRTITLASIAPLVVGAALLVAGGVRLGQGGGRRQAARVGWGPWMARGGAGMVLSGSF